MASTTAASEVMKGSTSSPSAVRSPSAFESRSSFSEYEERSSGEEECLDATESVVLRLRRRSFSIRAARCERSHDFKKRDFEGSFSRSSRHEGRPSIY